MTDNFYLIIDRIEGDTAVCEDSGRNHRNIQLIDITGPAQEGDLLRRDPTGERYAVDPAATERRRQELFRRQQALFRRSSDEGTK